jgi:hypothetical protein
VYLSVSILIALLLAQAPAPSGQASIEGTVVNAVSGTPLSNATVVLEGIAPAIAGVRLDAHTDATGAFILRNIDPNKYRMHAERTGFVNAVYGAPIALQPGMAMHDVTFKLMPQGVVTGRITDPDGEPIANATVALGRIVYDNHGRRRLANFNQASTNDLGEYRIFNIPPSRYYLSATPPSPGSYSPTWYAGTTDTQAAAQLDIKPGQTASGVNLALLKSVEQSIGGTIDSRNTGPAGPIRIHLEPRGTALPAMANISTVVPDSASGFTIQAPPGEYNLIAQKTGAGRTRFTGIAPVDVTTHDVTGINVTLQPPVAISGKLSIAGSGDLKALANSNVQVTAESKYLMPDVPPAPVAADGTFSLTSTGLESLSIGVVGMPPGYYVKSITYAQQDVKETGLAYVESADLLDIVVSPNGASVSGVVHDKGGEPIAGATVVLTPGFRTTETDQTGYFAIGSLAPGDYTLFAWNQIQPNQYYDPDFLKSVEDRGQPVALQEGSQEVVNYEAVVSPDVVSPDAASPDAAPAAQ